jgi:hypothetical protein
MMTKYVMAIFTAIALLISTACGKPAPLEARLDVEFTLSPGQMANIATENLSLKFVELVSDSRCPTGATCIWAGEASCLLEITTAQSTYQKVLTQSGGSVSKSVVGDYEISFAVEPYPEMGKQIDKKDYRLKLTVKKAALSGGILATFDVINEQYNIFITNTKTIEQVFALQRGESQATIPNGRITKESVSYNQPWSWHIDPDEVSMAEITIEL